MSPDSPVLRSLGGWTPEQALSRLRRAQRWVVKIGSAILTNNGEGLDVNRLAAWVEALAGLRANGAEVILVSSGAVAAGMARLGWTSRPRRLPELQAAAAVGQMGLAQAWEAAFQRQHIQTAQVLLTHDDLSDRQRYLNARATIRTLLGVGVVPVVNENDTVVNDEIRFGDNDTLAALVANLVEADLLVILTDQLGLYEADPRTRPDAALIALAAATDPMLDEMAGDASGQFGRGGMQTKLRAARLAARSGAATLIMSGRDPAGLRYWDQSLPSGTLLLPEQDRWVARKRWLAGHLQTRGAVTIDAGAVRVLRNTGSSLLPVGVTAVAGDFRRGEMVRCLDPAGVEVARGLVNYDALEVQRIKGKASDTIGEILGYANEPELIGRDNLVLV